MKNLIFILIFLLGFLSNKTAFAMANKAIVSEKQTINNIPKQKKTSYLEKVFNKKIEKIVNNKGNFSETVADILVGIGIVLMFGLVISLVFLIIWVALIPFGGLGISIWWLIGSAVFFGGLVFLLITLGIISGH
jgi:hypothetical protein